MRHKLKVFPDSSENKVEDRNGILNVYVKEKAEKNKANTAVLKLLARYFKIDYRKIKLKGLNSRNKVIEWE